MARQERLRNADSRAMEIQRNVETPYDGRAYLDSGDYFTHGLSGGSATPSVGVSQFRGGGAVPSSGLSEHRGGARLSKEAFLKRMAEGRAKKKAMKGGVSPSMIKEHERLAKVLEKGDKKALAKEAKIQKKELLKMKGKGHVVGAGYDSSSSSSSSSNSDGMTGKGMRREVARGRADVRALEEEDERVNPIDELHGGADYIDDEWTLAHLRGGGRPGHAMGERLAEHLSSTHGGAYVRDFYEGMGYYQQMPPVEPPKQAERSLGEKIKNEFVNPDSKLRSEIIPKVDNFMTYAQYPLDVAGVAIGNPMLGTEIKGLTASVAVVNEGARGIQKARSRAQLGDSSGAVGEMLDSARNILPIVVSTRMPTGRSATASSFRPALTNGAPRTASRAPLAIMDRPAPRRAPLAIMDRPAPSFASSTATFREPSASTLPFGRNAQMDAELATPARPPSITPASVQNLRTSGAKKLPPMSQWLRDRFGTPIKPTNYIERGSGRRGGVKAEPYEGFENDEIYERYIDDPNYEFLGHNYQIRNPYYTHLSPRTVFFDTRERKFIFGQTPQEKADTENIIGYLKSQKARRGRGKAQSKPAVPPVKGMDVEANPIFDPSDMLRMNGATSLNVRGRPPFYVGEAVLDKSDRPETAFEAEFRRRFMRTTGQVKKASGKPRKLKGQTTVIEGGGNAPSSGYTKVVNVEEEERKEKEKAKKKRVPILAQGPMPIEPSQTVPKEKKASGKRRKPDLDDYTFIGLPLKREPKKSGLKAKVLKTTLEVPAKTAEDVEASDILTKMKASGKKRRAPASAGDGRKKRAEIVRKVMKEHGLSMIEASKKVKADGLY